VRLLVNALSIGSMSGEHVVYGFLRELLAEQGRGNELLILHTHTQTPPRELVELGAQLVPVSDQLKRWVFRVCWEVVKLPGLLRRHRIDRVLNVSGGITPFLSVPQVSLCMNPWCYVPIARGGWKDATKAFFQRHYYRYAFTHAEHMIYISQHLRCLYRMHNRRLLTQEAPSTIAWVGLDEAIFESASRQDDRHRKPGSILAVSAWARWKGLDTTLHALRKLIDRGTPASLTVAGPWPDQIYERQIAHLIRDLQLDDHVEVLGKVTLPQLHELYGQHQVYCLMSSCESFGIPAAEAMAFGTPVVSTQNCAIAEVCSGAGYFGPAGDAEWTTRSLEVLLNDTAQWKFFSDQAVLSAAQLRWPQVSQPLHDVLYSRNDEDPSGAASEVSAVN